MRFAEFLKDQKIVQPQRFIQKPSVSVIMPTYCRAHDGLLARAIRSVLSQTFSGFEFIIVDDGSTDGSEDIIREFQKQDDRILYIRHEVNSGLAALRADEGILLSRADYVAVQTDDDEWLGPFLQTVLREAVAKSKPFVHCQAEWLMQGKVHLSPFPVMQPTYLSLLQGNKIGHSSTLMHRSILREIGLYDPHVILRRWTDWDLWLRVAREITPYMIPEVLVRVYGGLPDSIGVRIPAIEYEDYMLLLAQLSRNADLKFENIRDYDVTSLGRYFSVLPEDSIVSLYRNTVCPWLTQHEEQLVSLGVSFEEITKIKQEIAACSTGTEIINRIPLEKADNKRLLFYKNTILTKKKLSSGIAGIRRLVRKLLQPFPPLLRLAQASYWFFCSIPIICKNLTLDFQRIKDDPLMLSYRKRGFLLNKSYNLQDVPLLSYEISVQGGSLCAILLAFAIEEPKARGVVGVDLVSRENQIVAYAAMPVTYMNTDKPVEFFFEPPVKPGEYYLRVGGRGLSAPLSIYELQKHTSHGQDTIRKPFCGLVLA